MERKKLIHEADELMKDYCNDCFLYKQNKEDIGKRNAHRFCISQCTVGIKLREYGERLTGTYKEKK
ncbi:zinc-finger domain-containing protein [Bacillus sp. B1-b2]|uniref:zinc-finger domain-containing protein n=1 Tax=Bacillus sp. B1-b2 TaxID=2653201 RepID=UPI001261F320|nr:zinc-finger domain-containing protein [Bacillus sp. B1-b2]KAB7672986.1 zinc-finger domain-containing protein [Bacillus sp. B1-b2]